MKRLFVSIPLPETITDQLMDLMVETEGFHWTPLDQLHITLVFIGATPEHEVQDIAEALSVIHLNHFKLQISGAGVFVGPKGTQILWAGFKPNPALTQLHHQIRSALLALNMSLEKKKFKPHITLARIKNAESPRIQGYVQEFLQTYGCYHGPELEVHVFSLYESILHKNGSYYENLCDFMLL